MDSSLASALPALVGGLAAHSRRQRQAAAQKVYSVAKEDPSAILPYLNDLLDALGRPEAQTRWEVLDTLTPRHIPRRCSRASMQRRRRSLMRTPLRYAWRPSDSSQHMGRLLKLARMRCGLSWTKPYSATMGMPNTGTCLLPSMIWHRVRYRRSALMSFSTGLPSIRRVEPATSRRSPRILQRNSKERFIEHGRKEAGNRTGHEEGRCCKG